MVIDPIENDVISNNQIIYSTFLFSRYIIEVFKNVSIGV